MDCNTEKMGCYGGYAQAVYETVQAIGQVLDSDYPYTRTQATCRASSFKPKGFVDTIPQVKSNSSADLLRAIATGPVSVAVEADKAVFQNYTSGIFNSAACGVSVDHLVAAVGYGEAGTQVYYIVRNSWGAQWGDQGYINILSVFGANENGICGIHKKPGYATMKKA